jgi:tRNA-dihydrouridine synthase B
MMLAQAARYNIERGAQIIDINMGCPAKKVCHLAAGSSLLRDEILVARILQAVVQACGPLVPVTLKTRTGWSRDQRNAVRIARLAQDSGIALLSLHGRTRCDFYAGSAEYDTIAEVKASVSIPVVANGDIDSPEKAAQVLQYTGADAVMIGRAAQGRPWIFREIVYYLRTGQTLPAPTIGEAKTALLQHLEQHYAFYGELTGLRTARKHIGWYVQALPQGEWFRARMNTLNDCANQYRAVADYFDQMGPAHQHLSYSTPSSHREAA